MHHLLLPERKGEFDNVNHGNGKVPGKSLEVTRSHLDVNGRGGFVCPVGKAWEGKQAPEECVPSIYSHRNCPQPGLSSRTDLPLPEG